jgi:hypothetical protein
MVGRMGKATNWPDDIEEQRSLDERQSMWGEIPGKVVSYDAKAQTATVKPLFKPMHNGKPVEMPELYEVPVRMQRAGKGAMTFPVAAGDKVTLRPQMRSMENYHEKDEGNASDARSFSVADMEAHIAGGESLKDPIKNYDDKNVHMRFDEEGKFGIRGSKEGKVKIEGSQGNIYELIAQFMELVASDELMINYGSSAGTGHRLYNRAPLMAIAAKIRAMAL